MYEDGSDEDSLTERKSRKKTEPRKSGRAVKVKSYHEDEISGDDIDKEMYSDEETEQADTDLKPGRRSTGRRAAANEAMRRAAANEAMRRNTTNDSDVASGEDADDDEFSSGDIEESDSDFEEAKAQGKRAKNSKSKRVANRKSMKRIQTLNLTQMRTRAISILTLKMKHMNMQTMELSEGE